MEKRILDNFSVVGFVPARSGSTRLKNKNIKLIGGRPLIYWTVVKAIKSKKFDKIIFSSDSLLYFKYLLKYLKRDNIKFRNLVFDHRAKSHSQKKSKIFDYLKNDLIKKFKLNKHDLIVQMLPTCPMRSIKTIKDTIDFSLKYKKNCFTVCQYDFHLSFGLSLKPNHKWSTVFKNSPLITGKTQSQDQKVFYHPNGSISCLYVKNLNKNLKTIYHNALAFPVSRNESFDIDNFSDFKLVEKIIS